MIGLLLFVDWFMYVT